MLSAESSTPALVSTSLPLSPSTTARAPAAVPSAVMESPAAPPITTFAPLPILIVSTPPAEPFVVVASVVPAFGPLVKTSIFPSSPST